MNIENFLEWLQQEHGLKNRSQAVRMAAIMMRKRELSIWRWLTEKAKCPEDSLLMMELIVENHDLKERLENLEKSKE